jgi:predicted nucleic acid-binding protein
LFQQDSDWHTEAFALAELANVLATQVRVRGLSLSDANQVLSQARLLVEAGLHRAGDEDVLSLAVQHATSAYDARFLAVAQALGCKLTTEDTKLRRAAPVLTQSLEEALSSADGSVE